MNYTLEEANRYFAKAYNQQFWQLWEKKDATAEDRDQMVHLAHASMLHWANSPNCQPANLSRGENLLAMAYFAAGRSAPALYHAQKCSEITHRHRSEMKDFDFAHCSLVLAMALHLNGRLADAAASLKEAQRLGEEIRGEKDKEIFMGDWRRAVELMK